MSAIARRIGPALVLSLVVGSFVYSALALHLTTVYAATCNCTEEQMDAHLFCYQQYGDATLFDFTCPDGNNYDVICQGDPHFNYWVIPCD